jgi:hypothetical protein
MLGEPPGNVLGEPLGRARRRHSLIQRVRTPKASLVGELAGCLGTISGGPYARSQELDQAPARPGLRPGEFRGKLEC